MATITYGNLGNLVAEHFTQERFEAWIASLPNNRTFEMWSGQLNPLAQFLNYDEELIAAIDNEWAWTYVDRQTNGEQPFLQGIGATAPKFDAPAWAVAISQKIDAYAESVGKLWTWMSAGEIKQALA